MRTQIVLVVLSMCMLSFKCIVIHPYYKGLQMGIGSDSKIGRVFGTALESTATQVEDYADGQETEWKLTQITSSRQMNEALGIATSGSFRGFGASISASASFSQSSSINQYSTHLLVQVSVRNAARNIPRPKLSQEAQEFYTQYGLKRFEEVYGSEYLGGVVSGGMYLGMITVETKTQAEKQSIAVGVKFSGFGAEASLTVSSSASEILDNRRVEVYGVQIGGEPQMLATNISNMIQQLQQFPTQVKDLPVPIEGIFHKYRNTIAFDWQGEGVNFLIRNRLLSSLSVKMSQLKDRKDDLQYVFNNYNQFEELAQKNDSSRQSDLEQIQAEINEIISESNMIDEIAVDCSQNTTKCVEPQINYVPIFQLPELREDLISESSGMGMLFFGDLNNIPFGWRLCDGQTINGLTVPDLQGRFPLGAMNAMTGSHRVDSANNLIIGTTGGSSTYQLTIDELPPHDHTLSDVGDHSHRFEDYFFSHPSCGGNRLFGADAPYDNDNDYCGTEHSTYPSGSHSHEVGVSGTGNEFEVVPPYTIVYFICKVQ